MADTDPSSTTDRPTPRAHLRSATAAWWRELHGIPEAGAGGAEGVRRPNRRGERAELARCPTAQAIALTPAYHRLRRQLGSTIRGLGHRADELLAVLAGVLASVDESTDETLVVRLASGDRKARMSGLRFRRLLAVKRPDDLLAKLRQAVRLVDRTANVPQLAEDVLHFLDESESVQKSWARTYYDHAPSEN